MKRFYLWLVLTCVLATTTLSTVAVLHAGEDQKQVCPNRCSEINVIITYAPNLRVGE